MDTNYFDGFWTPDSVFFMISVLACFLIGLLVGWLLQSGKARRYRKEAEKWKKSHDELTIQHNALREEFDLKEADLVKAQREAQEAIDAASALRAEKAKWQTDLDAALEDSVKWQASIDSQQATIEDLNSQILGLKALNAELQTGDGTAITATHNADHAATLKRLNELETKLNSLSSESSGGDEAAGQRIAALEEKVNNLAAENDSLNTRLSDQPGTAENGTSNDDTIYAAAPETATVNKGETIAISAVAARNEITAANGTAWPAATEDEKDDLTRIKGIGAFLEQKLNGLDIYKYEQLSKFTPEWTERLTAAIEFFPGRIERDDWVGQATRLMEIKADSPEALAPSAVFVKNPEDLKIVEGIGPKIETLLKKDGIKDLQTLSTTPEKRLREILFAAGSRYRMHDPTTWSIQAELASKGEWDTLKDLQDKLKGGKEV